MDLHGLVLLNSLREMKTGASRSVRLASRHLRYYGIHLHFAATRTIVHFLHSLQQCGRARFNFLLFNGLASLSHRSQFGPPLAQIAFSLNVPVVIYWHETDWVLDRHAREHPVSAKTVDRIATHRSVTHLTASEAGAESLRSHYPGTAPTIIYECTTVPTPFDRPVRPASPPYVINLASIQERKGTDLFVDTAITVCRQHPNVEFLWLGSGESYGTWRKEIEAAGLKHRILFPGYVGAGYLLLRRASVFFLSSRDDPFPLSNLEAMCLARSIVTFNVGGAPEALGIDGTVVRPFDTQAAADAILRLLGRPPEELINEAVRRRYLEHYTPERFASRLNHSIRRNICYGR
jgi:glycosyltransferase involved in cell wall biosynthesis